MNPSTPPADAGWTDYERQRRALCLAGRTVVANRKKDKRLIAWAEAEGLLVHIGRVNRNPPLPASDWKNPHWMRGDGKEEREKVCDEFKRHLAGRPDLMARIGELRGKVLACWCKPERCHGDHLAAIANAGREELAGAPHQRDLFDQEADR